MSALPRHVAASPALRSLEALWQARPADALQSLRARAMRRFLDLGLPTTQDESWRYTSLRRLAARSLSAALRPAAADTAAASLDLFGDPAPVIEYRLSNGGCPAGTGALGAGREAGIEARSLRDLLRTDPDRLAALLEPLPEEDEGRWALLNTAMFDDGLHLALSRPLAAPILIRHAAGATGPDEISHPRVIIEIAAGAAATIVELHSGAGAHLPVVNSTTRLNLGRGARVEHYRVFAAGDTATHFDTLEVRQEADSDCRQFTVALRGDLVRAHLHARLEQRGASLDARALLVGHGTRHVDYVAVATHQAPDTRSRQTARAIASGSSRVVVNSKVVVRAGAVRADSQQSCRGLLLSPESEIDSRPQLEIHADEVKCAHGAAIGRLDRDMLFYLLSRGLDRATAQSLLVFAFLADVLTDMSMPAARAALENALIAQLPDSNTVRQFR